MKESRLVLALKNRTLPLVVHLYCNIHAVKTAVKLSSYDHGRLVTGHRPHHFAPRGT